VSKTQSILKLKCPRCREGNLFKKKGLFVYKGMFSMHERCTSCDLKYESEPGFWLGALWASYPLVIMIELPFLFLALFGGWENPYIALYIMTVAFMVLCPVFIRLGRSIWIHAWVKYKPSKK
jgi:uncharacterized protein (DUF983 family)